METKSFKVQGLTDNKSASRLRNAVSALSGVSNAAVDVNESNLTVTFDPTTTDISTIKNTISGSGFSIR